MISRLRYEFKYSNISLLSKVCVEKFVQFYSTVTGRQNQMFIYLGQIIKHSGQNNLLPFFKIKVKYHIKYRKVMKQEYKDNNVHDIGNT